MPGPPPASVLHAFGLDSDGSSAPQSLDGGQGTSYLVASQAVLKPVEDSEAVEATMQLSEQLLQRESQEYRIPRPLLVTESSSSSSSRYIAAGWAGTEYLAGTSTDPRGHWRELLAASRAFHQDLHTLINEPPAYIAQRTDRWARADRLLWDSYPDALKEYRQLLPETFLPCFDKLMSLRAYPDLQTLNTQLVHGDLAGNVLFAESEKPAIIDFSLYWRPVEYAEAMIGADGLLFDGAGEEVLGLIGKSAIRREILLIALTFRLLAGCERLGIKAKEKEEIGGEEVEGEKDDEAEVFAGQLGRAIEIVEKRTWEKE